MVKCHHKWVLTPSKRPEKFTRQFLCPVCSAGPQLYRCTRCNRYKLKGPFHTIKATTGELVRERTVVYLTKAEWRDGTERLIEYHTRTERKKK